MKRYLTQYSIDGIPYQGFVDATSLEQAEYLASKLSPPQEIVGTLSTVVNVESTETGDAELPPGQEFLHRDYGLVMSFYIDTDGYTPRDREMFTCGVEFYMVYDAAVTRRGWCQCVHKENASRIRMMLGKLGIHFNMDEYDDEWMQLSFDGDCEI